MATTTNYSWSTPDDTALVKDGAAAIRSLGTAIDTTVFTNAGAAIAKTIVDAKGDIIAATADNTVARLAVGANDTVLTADSTTATGLKWATPSGGAGNMVLIASGSLSGASVSITSLSTYTELYLQFQDATNNSGADFTWLTINSNGAQDYEDFGFKWDGSAMSRYQGASTFFSLSADSVNRTTATNQFTIFLSNCKNPGFTRSATISEYVRQGGGNGIFNARGVYDVSEAVSSIQFGNFGGTWSAGTYRLWGA
jgi:hypothetical protein